MALNFKDFIAVDYTQTGDPQLAKNAKKRKGSIHYDEELNPQQRRKAARRLQRTRKRVQRGAERARNRMASPAVIDRRAQKAGRAFLFKKLTKGIPKSKMTLQRRQAIEKRLDSPQMKRKAAQLARKLKPMVRKREVERKQSRKEKQKSK